MKYLLCITLLVCIVGADALAGGPWVQKPKKVRLTFGYSRKTAGSLWRNGVLEEPADSTLVDGLFHDFRYYYLTGEIGLFENLELSGTINYLVGYERVSSDPVTGKPVAPHMEVNRGFTDSWLNLKYQFLQGDYPMAFMVSSRFPDLYDEPGDVYARYMSRTYTVPLDTTTADGKDTVVSRKRTDVGESGEWRGLLKRDLGFHLLAGHSFNGDGYVSAMIGYNLRQGAFADQLVFSIDGGYNFPVGGGFTVMPKLAFDYTGGVNNGNLPDSSDRFSFRLPDGTPRQNYYFNNGKYGRLYGSAIASSDAGYGLEIGVGRWIFGDGSAVYWETFAQASYAF